MKGQKKERMGLGRALIAAGVLVSGLCLAGQAMANPISISASVGGVPTGADHYESFDSLPLGSAGGTTSSGLVVSFQPDGSAVTGAVSGRYAAPYLSNSNGALFGDPTTSGADATTYLTSGLGKVILNFGGSEQYLGLLWGSVDAGNMLTFYSGGVEQGFITGLDVTALANGDQGASGTFYVNINTSFLFDQVVATSSAYAFEFDNVAFAANPLGVPEPGEIGLFLLGLLLIGAGYRYQKRKLV